MELDPERARIKIIELVVSRNIWMGIAVFFCVCTFIWVPLIFNECRITRNEIKKIRKQQEKQGALLEKVYKEKEQDQKKYLLRYRIC